MGRTERRHSEKLGSSTRVKFSTILYERMLCALRGECFCAILQGNRLTAFQYVKMQEGG